MSGVRGECGRWQHARANAHPSAQVSSGAGQCGQTAVHVWMSVPRRWCPGELLPARVCAGLTPSRLRAGQRGQAYVAMCARVSCSCARSPEVVSSPRLCPKVPPPSLPLQSPVTQGSEPGHSPWWRLWFRLLSEPCPGPVAAALQPPGSSRESPFRPPEGGEFP